MIEPRDDLPNGTVTLLFTDIEGSTRLVHELGDAYADALAEHRRTLRAAFAAEGGIEVDTQGDSFFYVFRSAKRAVAAARRAQDALDGGQVRVRMGLHTGEPVLTSEGYVGMDVHRAARIMAAGHGGQVLLSHATRDLLDAAENLTDLGEHRLKDLNAPQRLWQIGDAQFPALRTLHRSNLPVQPTPLIGRERELAESGRLLREHRLLTFTGPGGSGKTRLALQLAADALDDYPDGVWWVPLAAFSDSRLVLPAIARTLETSAELGAYLSNKRLLLLLDNFEQVVSAATEVSELLAATTALTLIVTSREPLRIAGEREISVQPLAEDEAVALFTQRATIAEPADAVLAICRRLDCLPLAVELAAARTALLPPVEMVKRLDSALSMLTQGRRDAPARQRTLRATIGWSYDLLAPAEQALFRHLAVFVGSFSLPAAEAVAGADLDTIASLLDKSLVRRLASGRLGMFDTIADFARELLAALPDVESLRAAHATYFLELGERTARDLRSAREPTAALDELEDEHPNLRAAFEWLLAAGRNRDALLLAGALGDFWIYHSHLAEGRAWLERTLALADPADPDQDHLRAQALHPLSIIATQQSDWQMVEALSRERLEIAQRLDDAEYMAEALLTVGRADLARGHAQTAQEHFEQGLQRARDAQSPFIEGMALFNLGYVALSLRHFERARLLMRATREHFRATGEPLGEARACIALGAIAVHEGSLDQAVPLLQEGLSRSMRQVVPEAHAWALEMLGCALVEARPETAACLLGAAESARSALGLKLEGAELLVHERALTQLGSPPAWDAAWVRGRGLGLEEATALALLPTD